MEKTVISSTEQDQYVSLKNLSTSSLTAVRNISIIENLGCVKYMRGSVTGSN